jgi:predicted RNA polymerase sigma factor
VIAATIGARGVRRSPARSAEVALAALETSPRVRVDDYQPYWALRATCSPRSAGPARRPRRSRAIGLSEDAAVRDFLVGESSRLDA